MTGGVKEAENLYSSPFDTSVEKSHLWTIGKTILSQTKKVWLLVGKRVTEKASILFG